MLLRVNDTKKGKSFSVLLWDMIVRKYSSKTEGMSDMPRLKIIQVSYVFLHLDVLISVIVIFRT